MSIPIIRDPIPEVKPPRLIHICLDHKIADLTLEIFVTTGCDWQQALTTALAELPDLIAYAMEWDEWAVEVH
jgi:hypothetical protein